MIYPSTKKVASAGTIQYCNTRRARNALNNIQSTCTLSDYDYIIPVESFDQSFISICIHKQYAKRVSWANSYEVCANSGNNFSSISHNYLQN